MQRQTPLDRTELEKPFERFLIFHCRFVIAEAGEFVSIGRLLHASVSGQIASRSS